MSENIVNLEDTKFDDIILKGDEPVVVDFWSDWCGPCKMLSPIVEDLAEEYEGKVRFYKATPETCPDSCREYGVQALPTLLYVNKGKIHAKEVGLKTKKEIEKHIKKMLKG